MAGTGRHLRDKPISLTGEQRVIIRLALRGAVDAVLVLLHGHNVGIAEDVQSEAARKKRQQSGLGQLMRE